jgi:hypothetical protein
MSVAVAYKQTSRQSPRSLVICTAQSEHTCSRLFCSALAEAKCILAQVGAPAAWLLLLPPPPLLLLLLLLLQGCQEAL